MEADEVLAWKYYLASEPRCWKRLDYLGAQISQAVYQILLSFSNGNTKSISLNECLLNFINKEQKEELRKREMVKQGMALMQMIQTTKNLKNNVSGIDKLQEDIRKLTSKT